VFAPAARVAGRVACGVPVKYGRLLFAVPDRGQVAAVRRQESSSGSIPVGSFISWLDHPIGSRVSWSDDGLLARTISATLAPVSDTCLSRAWVTAWIAFQ
jgi:hypothetical protein